MLKQMSQFIMWDLQSTLEIYESLIILAHTSHSSSSSWQEYDKSTKYIPSELLYDWGLYWIIFVVMILHMAITK